jgi:hypothetical protein
MRFKARISNENISLLTGVTSVLERIGQTTAIYLDEQFVRLAVITESPDTPKVYAELRADVLFADYRIESQSSNSIFFEIELDLLTRALSSGKTAPMCCLKLVKRGLRPCLCMETRASEVEIVHDIPIKLLRASDIDLYRPPNVPNPQVALDLPRGKLMKTIIDRMSKLAKHVVITAEQAGRIVVSIDHSSAVIKTYYSGLQPRFDALDRVSDAHNKASVMLDIRKLAAILNLHIMMWENTAIYIVENEALVINVVLSPHEAGTVTFYVPVVMMNEWERSDHHNTHGSTTVE